MKKRKLEITIRAGIGGLIYASCRRMLYPTGLNRADEIAFAARHVTSIEINATR